MCSHQPSLFYGNPELWIVIAATSYLTKHMLLTLLKSQKRVKNQTNKSKQKTTPENNPYLSAPPPLPIEGRNKNTIIPKERREHKTPTSKTSRQERSRQHVCYSITYNIMRWGGDRGYFVLVCWLGFYSVNVILIFVFSSTL